MNFFEVLVRERVAGCVVLLISGTTEEDITWVEKNIPKEYMNSLNNLYTTEHRLDFLQVNRFKPDDSDLFYALVDMVISRVDERSFYLKADSVEEAETSADLAFGHPDGVTFLRSVEEAELLEEFGDRVISVSALREALEKRDTGKNQWPIEDHSEELLTEDSFSEETSIH